MLIYSYTLHGIYNVPDRNGRADESETIDIAIKTMDWAGEITDEKVV